MPGCEKEEVQKNQSEQQEIPEEANSGILAFNSQDDLGSVVSFLRETDTFELSSTRAVSRNFVSLRDKLITQGLREFTDAELAIIESEGLIYEPEDELIADPYFMAVLNEDREIQVGKSRGISLWMDGNRGGTQVQDVSISGSTQNARWNASI